MKKKEISIIIIHYNAADYLERCLTSLLKNTNLDMWELILIDNASPDKTWRERIPDSFTNLKIISLSENKGFAGAANYGVSQANGEYLFFVNPDTLFTHDCLSVMIEFCKTHDRCGTVGPKILNFDNSLQPSRGTFPHFLLSIAQIFHLKKYIPNDELMGRSIGWILGNYFAQWKKYEGPQKVDYTTGAALMISKDVFEQIGGFDDRFFLYFEEIDLCKRLHLQGFTNYFLPMVEIVHAVDKSQEPFSGFKEQQYYRSLYYYYEKHSSGIILNLIKLTVRLKVYSLYFLLLIRLLISESNKHDRTQLKHYQRLLKLI